MADSTLNAIRLKVRRLTRSPSTQQISDADIDEYINTFIAYDMPSHLRLFNLRRTFTFYTQPNIDTYFTNTTLASDPLFNFKNVIISTHDPIYVAGYKIWFSQSREEFFARWDKLKQIQQVATGDGVTLNFTGTLSNIPVLPHEVLFTSIDANGNATGLVSSPVISAFTGIQTQNGNFYDTEGPIIENPTAVTPANTINFVTGVYTITFANAPANGEPINVQAIPYVAARPTSILYFNNTFTLRPVPDKQYDVTIEAYVRPTQLLTAATSPQQEQWWQYIAYGAAKKVLEDRTDFDTVQLLLPEFKKQEQLVLRTTLVQQGDDRAFTIYADQSSVSAGPWGWWGGNSF